MSGTPSAVRSPQLSAHDTEQIAAIFDDMASGFDARDAEHADRHFTSDATLVTPDGRRVQGLDALLRYHEHRLAGPAGRWGTTYRVIAATRIDDRTAVVHTAQDTTTADGAFRNHGTFVLVERAGSWWIAAAHNTNVEVDRGAAGGDPDGSIQPPPVRQLRLVVEAEDFDAAVTFYRDVLGLGEAAAFEGDGDARVTILDAGRATLELANPAQKRMIDDVEADGRPSDRIRVAFEVDDTAATYDALRAAGAEVVAEPTETPWRSLNARLNAPAGLQITIFEELAPERRAR